jgi:hypothetical protein
MLRLGHPELQTGEMWIFNLKKDPLNDDTYEGLNWNTKRKGKVAYDQGGNIDDNAYPIFIRISEYNDSINGFFS